MLLPRRKHEILSILSNSPLTNSEISEMLGISPSAVSDHVKKLVSEGLVRKNGRRHSLTLKGLITLHAADMLERTMSVLKKNREFWEEHDLTAIPPHLLLRLGELGNYRIIKSGENEVLRHKEKFMEIVMGSEWVRAVFGFFLPDYVPLLVRLSQRADVSVVVSGDVAVKLERYRNIMKNFRGELSVCDDLRMVCIASNKGLCLGLFLKNGEYDVQRGMISHDSSAVRWGTDVHDHYTKSVHLVKA